MTKLWGLAEEDRELARRANERVEALEKKIGRKLDHNDLILLEILSLYPDTPFEPLLSPPED